MTKHWKKQNIYYRPLRHTPCWKTKQYNLSLGNEIYCNAKIFHCSVFQHGVCRILQLGWIKLTHFKNMKFCEVLCLLVSLACQLLPDCAVACYTPLDKSYFQCYKTMQVSLKKIISIPFVLHPKEINLKLVNSITYSSNQNWVKTKQYPHNCFCELLFVFGWKLMALSRLECGSFTVENVALAEVNMLHECMSRWFPWNLFRLR